MKKAVTGLLVAIALAAGADRAAAQGTLPLSVGVRIDAGIPTGDAGDVFETGFGFGVEAALDLTPTFAIYGGYSQFQFNVEGLDDVEAEEDGFELGGRVLLGTGGAVWTPYVQAGVLFHEETGFEIGLGAEYPVGNALSLTPMVRYRSIEELDYVTLGVGLSLRL